MKSALVALALLLLLGPTMALAVEFQGNTHTALGSASLAITGAPPNQSLVVSNIGSSGGDGVIIEPVEADAPFTIGYGSFATSAFLLTHRATDAAGGRSFVVTAVHHGASEPTGYETGGEAGDSYRASFYSGPLKLFESMPAPPGLLAQSVLMPQSVVFVPGAAGDEFSIEYILPVPEELVSVPEQQSFTGDRIVITRIELGGAGAGPPLSMDEIHVTAADLPELTITSETPGSVTIPALSAWGGGILAGLLVAARFRVR